jgi:hypothetical protein
MGNDANRLRRQRLQRGGRGWGALAIGQMEQRQSPQNNPDRLNAAAKQLVQIAPVTRRNVNTQRHT